MILINELKRDFRWFTVNTKKNFSDFEKALEKLADRILNV